MNGCRCVVLLIALAGFVPAQDAGPAGLHVVIKYPPHRMCKPAFRAQLQAELLTQLRAAGLPARVSDFDVARKAPDAAPLLARIAERGIDALEVESGLHADKLHLATLEVTDTQFTVAVRQHDGFTGLASPAVRRTERVDPAALPRTLAAAIEADYGAIGEVSAFPDERTVRIRWRSSAAPLRGDVLLLSRVGNGRGTRVAAAVLRVRDIEATSCVCELYHRFATPLAGFPAVTYRAMRVAASEGPVRVRVFDEAGRAHTRLSVRVSARGYGPNDRDTERGVPVDGDYTSDQTYDRLAFVTVYSGERLIARAPVEVAGGVVTFQVREPPGGEREQQAEQDARYLQARILDIHARLRGVFAILAPWIDAADNARALQTVVAELDRLTSELADLDRLANLARGRPNRTPYERVTLDVFDATRIRVIAQSEKLKTTKQELEVALREEASPEAQAKKQVRRAMLSKAEEQKENADFDGAIQTYEAILSNDDWPEVRRRLQSLREAWTIRSPEHATAREQIYAVADRVRDANDVRHSLDAMVSAFAVCKNANDKLTPVKLLLELSRMAELLTKRRDELAGSQVERDRDEVRQIDEALPKLELLLRDVQGYLKS